ncbi:MAG: hypothetical protein HKO94_07310 [Flavobacteriaceae bacterium]|nr:hypothetical protein [Flavobacteriaceae bacterium]
MRNLLLLFFALISPLISIAQEAEKGLDERVNDAFMPIAEAWEGLVLYPVPIGEYQIPFVVILLVVGASFFTLIFKFPNIF